MLVLVFSPAAQFPHRIRVFIRKEILSFKGQPTSFPSLSTAGIENIDSTRSGGRDWGIYSTLSGVEIFCFIFFFFSAHLTIGIKPRNPMFD